MDTKFIMRRMDMVGVTSLVAMSVLAGGCKQILGIDDLQQSPMEPEPSDASPSGSDATPVDAYVDAAMQDALASCSAAGDPCPDGQYCIDQICEAPPAGMVAVPEGQFSMGCNNAMDGACAADESPYHVVNLSNFAIDRLEVSVGEYQACVEAGECSPPHDQNAYGDPCDWNLGNSYPITCVDWFQARAYCQYLGKRLPTEAEWEKAARGIDGRTYPWGAAAPTCEFAVFSDCGIPYLVQLAGSKPNGASPYGALDMAGNVFEWVNDWYSTSYYSVSPIDDPAGPDSGTRRVTRSSGANYDGSSLRASYRGVDFEVPTPSDGQANVGFRCAFTP